MKKFRWYYVIVLFIILAASFYPLKMGVSVLRDMACCGVVRAEDYPKYIIPYTPICVAVIIGVLIMPIAMKIVKKAAYPVAAVLSGGIFVLSEFFLESQVIVSNSLESVNLERWQMFMCAIAPNATNHRVWAEVNVLMGEYSPAFKLHFYLISILIIATVLNSIYGFAQIIKSSERTRVKALIVQTTATIAFVGMCIWACFTAFYRNGDINISPVSTLLMTVFFLLLGITGGVFAGSFIIGRKRVVSIFLPTLVALLLTAVMYVGELVLLSGHLYRFGKGILFDGLPGIVLAPVDILIILASGGLTGLICCLLNRRKAR